MKKKKNERSSILVPDGWLRKRNEKSKKFLWFNPNPNAFEISENRTPVFRTTTGGTNHYTKISRVLRVGSRYNKSNMTQNYEGDEGGVRGGVDEERRGEESSSRVVSSILFPHTRFFPFFFSLFYLGSCRTPIHGHHSNP